MDAELITKLLPKLDYSALVFAVQQLAGHVENIPEIPETLPEGELDASTLEHLHHVLFNIHVIDGHLICPGTARKFPIKQGIPNMILHEDEI